MKDTKANPSILLASLQLLIGAWEATAAALTAADKKKSEVQTAAENKKGFYWAADGGARSSSAELNEQMAVVSKCEAAHTDAKKELAACLRGSHPIVVEAIEPWMNADIDKMIKRDAPHLEGEPLVKARESMQTHWLVKQRLNLLRDFREQDMSPLHRAKQLAFLLGDYVQDK